MITAPTLTEELARRDFEQVVFCRDPEAGLSSVIAIHDTTFGPSLGGIRMRAYPSEADALADALNLAEAMTYKAVLANLPLGGGKSVINADPTSPHRDRMIEAHARYIGALGGRYIPSIDMGTGTDDLELTSRHVAVVASQQRDPSWFTAAGVVRSVEGALAWANEKGLPGMRVAVQGLGHVGGHLAAMLVDRGAQVVVADIDPGRVAEVVGRTSAEAVAVEEILLADVDVLCPCGPGGVVTEAIADVLKARFLIGAANNMLIDDALAGHLAERAIVHVPDFVANAGGLMAAAADVTAEVAGDEAGLGARIQAIADTSAEVLERSRTTGQDTINVAKDLARQRLAARRSHRPHFEQ